MRKVIAGLFISVDGVTESPDQWQEHFDEDMGEALNAQIADVDSILLGRVTYDEWASYWPTSNDPFGEFINNTPKYVVSSTLKTVEWGAFRVRHPEVRNPYGDCRLFGAVNDSLDARYSRPKTIATALIRFHVGRGDRIVFITSRCASSPPNDLTARYLATLFDLEELPTVRFTDLGRKVAAFQAEKPAIAYGDADSDIEDTIKASEGMPDTPIRAVRIMRSSFSSNPGAQNPGKFGEDVILDSDH
jgi:hypothetical protein